MRVERRRGRTRYVYSYETKRGAPRKRYLGSLADPVTEIVVRAEQLLKASNNAERADVENEIHAYGQLEPMLRLLARRVTRCVQRHKEKLNRRSVSRHTEGPPPHD